MDTDTVNKEMVEEEQLQEVTGGVWGPRDTKCWFELELSVKWKPYGEEWVEVKCKSNCQGFNVFCSCHGTFRCENKMHKALKLVEGIWCAYPADQYNHREYNKLIHDFFPNR